MYYTIAAVLLAFVAVGTAQPQECGNSPLVAPKIVGGVDAAANEIPWQVVMKYKSSDSLRCGGTIVDANWIITAAHCTNNQDPADYTWVAGEWSLRNTDGTEQELVADTYFVHEDYRPLTIENDITLVRLSTPLTFTAAVQPACLPAQGFEVTGDTVVSGWGSVRSGGLLSDILQKVTVPVVDDATCRGAYGESSIYDSMLCAGLEEGGKDSCQGDSGGPLVAKNAEGRWSLEGIVSWGQGCAEPGYPGVYTQVAYFIDWIEATIAANPPSKIQRDYPFIKQVKH